jgi:hypothetical protein
MKFLVTWQVHEDQRHEVLRTFAEMSEADDRADMGSKVKLIGRWHDLARAATGTRNTRRMGSGVYKNEVKAVRMENMTHGAKYGVRTTYEGQAVSNPTAPPDPMPYP